MKLHTLIKTLSFLVGVCIALIGAVWVFIATSVAVKTSSIGPYIAGAGFVLVAAPLLTFPFSVRAAKSLFILFMFTLALGMLWLAFQLNMPTNHSTLVQMAAIAFVVLLLARVGSAVHRKRSALRT